MVVHGDRERALGRLLTDHVLVEDLLDLLGIRIGYRRFGLFPLLLLRKDLILQREMHSLQM